jgi:ubiquinone/menaquinone biosynthesis C-methylase UbiE
MLNPCFPKELVTEETQGYALPQKVVSQVYGVNALFCNGPELRLQDIYGDELWMKLQSLGLGPAWWSGKTVLDLCCGTGFLSYHLLARAQPAHLTLLDISAMEVAEAEKLIRNTYKDRAVEFLCANALESRFPSASFDIVIGNSFLHHFPDVALALREFARILKPGGSFVSLHEPKPAAVAFESRNPTNWLSYARHGAGFVDTLRPGGDSLSPKQGADVWLFAERELSLILRGAGFENVHMEQWNFLRPLVVATAKLHHDVSRPRLGILGRVLLRAAVASDSLLRRLLPPQFFASLAFLAHKR